MNSRKRAYIFSWIALGLLLLSANLMLLLSLSDTKTGSAYLPMILLSFLLIIAIGIYLFIYASKWILFKKNEVIPEEIRKKPGLKEKGVATRMELDHLDIHGIAKKIVRRIAVEDKPELWGSELLKYLVDEMELMSGIFYLRNEINTFNAVSTYAYPQSFSPYSFSEGEGLNGQAAKNMQAIVYRSLPEEYTDVFSGLGSGKPSYLAIVPIVPDKKTIALFELAGFKWSDQKLEQLFQIISRELAEKIVSIQATSNEATSSSHPGNKSSETK